MTTRKQDKVKRAKIELARIYEVVRLRTIGQKMKDNIYTSMIFNNKDKPSPSKREQKKINKLKKKIG